MAPQQPANQFHHGNDRDATFFGIELNCWRVDFRAKITIAMTTRPEPKEITAEAFPSPNC